MKPPARTPPPLDREALKTSQGFLDFVEAEKIDAQRRRDDHQSEITRLTTEHQRITADYESMIMKLRTQVADCAEIIEAADRALGTDLSASRPAPTIAEHKDEQL